MANTTFRKIEDMAPALVASHMHLLQWARWVIAESVGKKGVSPMFDMLYQSDGVHDGLEDVMSSIDFVIAGMTIRNKKAIKQEYLRQVPVEDVLLLSALREFDDRLKTISDEC